MIFDLPKEMAHANTCIYTCTLDISYRGFDLILDSSFNLSLQYINLLSILRLVKMKFSLFNNLKIRPQKFYKKSNK